jgi:hypothetical protein
MSNTRSRHDQMVNYSNYWEDVHPILLEKPDKNFFLIAGDVGGNPDAVAAFYDKWDNVTLLASGMGEVVDENYLLVHIDEQDSVKLGLVPLDSSLILPDIEFYSVPPATGAIVGPELVFAGSSNIEYTVPEVFNATSYIWELPEGTSGTSTSDTIALNFNFDFAGGNLSVQAAREGFGSGPDTSLMIRAGITPVELNDEDSLSVQVNFKENNDYLTIGITCFNGDVLTIRLFESGGRLIKSEKIVTVGEYTEIQIDKKDLSKGILFLSISTQTKHVTEKLVIR